MELLHFIGQPDKKGSVLTVTLAMWEPFCGGRTAPSHLPPPPPAGCPHCHLGHDRTAWPLIHKCFSLRGILFPEIAALENVLSWGPWAQSPAPREPVSPWSRGGAPLSCSSPFETKGLSFWLWSLPTAAVAVDARSYPRGASRVPSTGGSEGYNARAPRPSSPKFTSCLL